MARKIKPSLSPRRVTENHILLGQRVRAARLKAGMSQEELGKELGVSFQQVQKYEKGVNRIDFDRLVNIAKVLTVDLQYFSAAVSTKRTEESIGFDAMLATREGVQIIEAMIELSQPQRQLILDIARKLPHVAA